MQQQADAEQPRAPRQQQSRIDDGRRRGVQRVETEGVASRETRVCLAAALDTDVGAILEAASGPVAAFRWSPWMLPILAGVLVFAVGTMLGVPRIVDYCAILLVSTGVLGHSLRK